MGIDTWQPPRCSHGKILLGCPDDDCPEQNKYLAEMRSAMDAYDEMMQENARRYVRGALGLPYEEPGS